MEKQAGLYGEGSGACEREEEQGVVELRPEAIDADTLAALIGAVIDLDRDNSGTVPEKSSRIQ